MIDYKIVVESLVGRLKEPGMPVELTVTENDIVLKLGKYTIRESAKPQVTNESYKHLLVSVLALVITLK